MKIELNNIKQSLPMGNLDYMYNTKKNNMNFMNMNMPMNNMNMPMNNINIPMNNMDMMNNNKFNTLQITFNASTGFKTTMAIEKTKTIEDLHKEYVKKIGLSEDSIGKDFMLLYIGAQLDPKSKERIESKFKKTFVIITVYDFKGVTQCLNITFDTSFRTEMAINKNKTIKEMMEAYANKIGFQKEAIGKEVIFIHEGEKLDAKLNDPVKSVLSDEAIVTMYDQGNVIVNLISNNGFSIYNMMNPNINNDFTKYNPYSSGIKDLIPRNPRTSIDYAKLVTITFNANTGRKDVIEMNSNKTIENMLKEYANKVYLPLDSIGKDVFFLFNGAQLDPKSQETIGSKFRVTACITVYDLYGIVSQWIIRFVEGKNEFIMRVYEGSTIKYMMEECADKIHVPKEDIGKKIIFLYNGNDLSTKQNDRIKSVLYDGATITVNHLI